MTRAGGSASPLSISILVNGVHLRPVFRTRKPNSLSIASSTQANIHTSHPKFKVHLPLALTDFSTL